MGKVKPKLRGLSEKASKKGTIHKNKLNPFEIHVNRQKYDVIGRKSKSERGLPGISRSRAMKKRQATLLQEYKIKDKSNKFLDRRIGEKNREMTQEDRVIARFTAERMKGFNKKQIYNLADDEVLTHRGQTLSEIEKYDDPRSDDDDDETTTDTGKLGADFVGDAHFGGGLRKSGEGDKRSRKDLIEQLIAESKKRKAEKLCTREQTIELTEKLDAEWQDLLPITASSKKKLSDVTEVEKPDSYDVMMRELKFEARVQASEPLKTEEEIKLEENRKRAELEAEREKRMLPDVGANEQSYKHRSADDLDDGFAIDDDPDVTISYDFEGNIQIDGQVENPEIGKGSRNSINRADICKESGKLDGDGKNDTHDDNEEEEESTSEEEEEENEDGETDDSLSDLKPLSENESEQDVENASLDTPKDYLEENRGSKSNIINDMMKPGKKIIVMDKALSREEKKTLLQEVRKKFPNFPNVPDNYESLQKILKLYDAERQGIIVSHIMDKNHIGLNEMNRTRLITLFGFLLKHLLHLSSKSAEESMRVLNYLAPLLFDLAHLSPENASQCVLEIIKEKQQEFQKKQHKYPTFDTLIFFKVVSLIYPTSDFRHPVVTPSIVFICQMLFKCHIKSRKDISAGLFLVTMFLEFTVLSKRFSPAAINFLCGILHLAIPKRMVSVQNALPNPPFRRFGTYSDLLVLENEVVEADYPLQMKLSDLSEETIDASFKIRALATAVSMLNESLINLSNLQASPSIFHRVAILLSKLPTENYPCILQSEIEKFSEAFEKLKERTVQYLVVERKRPKALRLYEPRIENVFDGKRRRPMGPVKMEREKLLHKIKQEKKSAMREIRRDNSFLAKLKWKETIQSDKERIQKVKEIFGAASSQLGDIRALERKKKHLK